MSRDQSVPKKINAIHLIPYDGIGGVEEAAKSMNGFESEIDFEIKYIFPYVKKQTERIKTYNILNVIDSVMYIRNKNPDILIVSLWRSSLVAILLRLTGWRGLVVLFLHNDADAHFMDRLVTRWCARLSNEIWADSDASAYNRLPKKVIGEKTVRRISFLFRKITPISISIRPNFVFWGRLSTQKNIKHSLKIFSKIHSARADSKFSIFGPDGGTESELRAEVERLGLSNAVIFEGAMPFDKIVNTICDRESSIYLQTSNREGMSLSVIEAMQLGLVPVVTPVGEIANYTKDGINAIHLSSEIEGSVGEELSILKLIENQSLYLNLRDNAISTWKADSCYKDEVTAAIKEATR